MNSEISSFWSLIRFCWWFKRSVWVSFSSDSSFDFWFKFYIYFLRSKTSLSLMLRLDLNWEICSIFLLTFSSKASETFLISSEFSKSSPLNAITFSSNYERICWRRDESCKIYFCFSSSFKRNVEIFAIFTLFFSSSYEISSSFEITRALLYVYAV